MVRKYGKYESSDDEIDVDTEVSSESSDDGSNDKYKSLNNKKKSIKKPIKKVSKTPIKVPAKPKLKISYTEVTGGNYNIQIENINDKDRQLYNKTYANIENIAKILSMLFTKRGKLMMSGTNDKELTEIEEDILQLNRLNRHYNSIIDLINNKYV